MTIPERPHPERPKPAAERAAAPEAPAEPPRQAPARPRPFGEVRFLTVAEVAAAMRVSKMTVYRLVHGGELPAVRVGRSFRVPEQAVSDYLQKAYFEAG
jgi:excisionase family DNA binding protein